MMRMSSDIGVTLGLSRGSVKRYNRAMNPQDRVLAREALLRQRLTIEQVTELSRECETTGRSFADAAVAKGYLTPELATELLGTKPAPVPPAYPRLLMGTMAILIVLVVVGLIHLARQHQADLRQADETIRSNAEAERQAAEVRPARQRELLERKKNELEKARAIMKEAEEARTPVSGDPQLYVRLVEATQRFTRWLEENPEDVPVLVERARAYELRQDFDRAMADIEKAIALRKDLAPALNDRLHELQLQSAIKSRK